MAWRSPRLWTGLIMPRLRYLVRGPDRARSSCGFTGFSDFFSHQPDNTHFSLQCIKHTRISITFSLTKSYLMSKYACIIVLLYPIRLELSFPNQNSVYSWRLYALLLSDEWFIQYIYNQIDIFLKHIIYIITRAVNRLKKINKLIARFEIH